MEIVGTGTGTGTRKYDVFHILVWDLIINWSELKMTQNLKQSSLTKESIFFPFLQTQHVFFTI